MKLNHNQKLSVLRILLDIIEADGRIDEREIFLFNKIKKEMGLIKKDFDSVKNFNSLIALANVKGMTEVQKKHVGKLMHDMIIIDEDIDPNEVYIYNLVCNVIQISQEELK